MKNTSTPFTVERKGYNRFEVEQCIKKLESDISRLENEVDTLKSQLASVILQKAELENKQSLIEDTLINAELAAREIVFRAETKVAEAEKLYQIESEKVEKKYQERKQDIEQVLKRVEYVLKSQLALIENE